MRPHRVAQRDITQQRITTMKTTTDTTRINAVKRHPQFIADVRALKAVASKRDLADFNLAVLSDDLVTAYAILQDYEIGTN
jgi:hypothetical protein